jgi:hypothetical protein
MQLVEQAVLIMFKESKKIWININGKHSISKNIDKVKFLLQYLNAGGLSYETRLVGCYKEKNRRPHLKAQHF